VIHNDQVVKDAQLARLPVCGQAKFLGKPDPYTSNRLLLKVRPSYKAQVQALLNNRPSTSDREYNDPSLMTSFRSGSLDLLPDGSLTPRGNGMTLFRIRHQSSASSSLPFNSTRLVPPYLPFPIDVLLHDLLIGIAFEGMISFGACPISGLIAIHRL
jgi:hypothetical protein